MSQTFNSPLDIMTHAHNAIRREIAGVFVGWSENAFTFLDNIINHCRYDLAEKRITGKPLSEDFVKGAEYVLATLQNLKQEQMENRNGP